MATASFVTKLLAAYVLVSSTVIGADDDFYQCMPDVEDSPGVTIPKGDTEVAVNSSDFDFFCHLNPNYYYYKDKGVRSNSLVFHLKNGDGADVILPSIIVNETTIKATYKPDHVTKDLIDCLVEIDGQEKGLCSQIFYVGYEPLPPENFTCISDNWQSLNCSWDVPYNPIKTSYTLHYVEPGHGNRHCETEMMNKTSLRASTKYIFNCMEYNPYVFEASHFELVGSNQLGNFSLKVPFDHIHFICPPAPGSPTSNNCYLKINPQYRKNWEYYIFYITAKNTLNPQAPWHWEKLEHFKVVLPKPPIIETLISRHPRSIDLRYTVDHNLHFFPPGLAQDVEYRSEYDDKWTKIESIDFIDTETGSWEVDHNITGLHPYTQYSVRIRMRSNDSNDLWSQYATQDVTTLPDVPEKAPNTTLGSFEIVTNDIQSRNVFVYWSQIDDELRNGPDFNYYITEVLRGNEPMAIVPQKVTKAYALFTHLRLSNYTFHVTSRNENGTANSTSKVFVPHNDQIRGLQPRSFTKVAYNDTLFELSWLPPANEAPVVSYTVFWCLSENNRDRPYQCEGQLDWQTVEKQNHSLNVTLPSEHVYQFAVSANTLDVSSGMTWATCTILHNRVVGKLKTVSIDVVKKTSMVVRWRLDCTDRVGIVSGYKVTYCPIDSFEDTADCSSQILVQETTEEKVEITNLEPYTIYKVAVSVITKAGDGEPSDYLVNRTARAAPSGPPENIGYKLVASNKVDLRWQLPKKPNGPISLYEVKYGYSDLFYRYSETKTNANEPRITLSDLDYYVKYDFKVRACGLLPESTNVVCGDWGAIIFWTGVGPSKPMPSPAVTFVNSTEVKVEWHTRQFQHGGPIKRYDLQICSEHTNACYIKTYENNKSKDTLLLDKINNDLAPDCQNSTVTNMFTFRIRSVTHNDSGDEFESPWSPDEIVPAYCQGDVPFVMIGIVVAVVAVVSILLCLYFLRCYKWSLETNNIFKDIDKEMEMAYTKEAVAIKKPIESFSPNNLPTSPSNQAPAVDPKVDWTEMNDMSSPNSGKHPSYQRSGSKDSMEILLDSKEKTVAANERGTSESTSGCESGQNYESDDLEVCAKSASQSPVSCSSENISKEHHQIDDHDWLQAPHAISNIPAAGPYSQITAVSANGANFWQPNQLISSNEGYTRAAMVLPAPTASSSNLEHLRPPPNLSFVTKGPQDKAYVTLQRFETQPQYQGGSLENDEDRLSNMSDSITPVVSPPSTSTNSFHFGPLPAERKPMSNGYITVDEANKMLLRQNVTDTPSDPRAYSKVAIAPISNAAAPANENPSSSTLVMSAKDLQVESKPPFKKVVTTLDDGNSVTRSTMV